MILFLKFFLLILSITGYFLFFTQKYHIKISFLPSLFCAWCSSMLFAAGLLNLLPEAAWLLYIGGFLLLALSVKHRYTFCRHDFVLYAVFVAVLIYFFCLMRSAHFTSYDNFSHWATVVKDMLLEDRMPNFEDTVIRFQSYPLGSSLFLYYICRVIGSGEDCMLWAQAFLLVSFLFSLTAFIHKKNRTLAMACGFYGIWALTVNVTIYELRVDTLLPLAGTAAFAVIYAYRRQPQKALCCSTGLFILLLQIKNSGIFFYAVCVLFLTVYTWKDIRCHKLRYFYAALLLPLSTLYLWKKHVAFAFPNGMETKHSMSIANYEQVFAKKTADDLTEIAHLILKRFTTIDSIEVKMMLVLTALFLILAVFLHSYSQSKKLLRMLAACWGCLAVYTISMYAMYIFSMPMGEASHLASYDRYILSVLIFIYGISVIFIINATTDALVYAKGRSADSISSDNIYFDAICAIHETGCQISADCMPAGNISADHIPVDTAENIFQKRSKNDQLKDSGIHTGKLCVILLTAALAAQVRLRLNTFIRQPDYTLTERYSLQRQLAEDGVKTGDSCMIYCKSTDYNSRYLFYLMRYELWTDDVLVVREKDFDQYRDKISDYDHFIIWDKQSKAAGATT